MLISILSFLVVIGICVISHEFGHYITAKWNGIQVHEFSFGMGPCLYQRRIGTTVWSLRVIPIGGFVRLAGMGEEKDNEQVLPGMDFMGKPAWRRFIVLASGSVTNIMVAILLTAFLLSTHGVLDLNSAKIGNVLKGYPAEKYGLERGDVILAVGDKPVHDWKEMSQAIKKSGETPGPVKIKVKKVNGEVRVIFAEIPLDPEYGYPLLGIQPSRVTYNPLSATLKSVSYIWNFSVQILEGIVRRISGSSGISVTGPLGIASMAGEAAKEGLWSFLSFLALINLHLGILNLFPFPALDGGRLALVVAEMIFRRRIPEKWEQYIHFIGFILLLSLLAAVTWKDLVKILTREGN